MNELATRIAVNNARKGISQYLWIMGALHQVDVSTDREFQRRYNSFCRVRQRSADWYSSYYGLLEANKRSGTDFAVVLNTLWTNLGRYEPSFSSKLVATINPSLPIWDRFVLQNTGLRAPAYTDPERLKKAPRVYGQIRNWYLSQLSTGDGRRKIEIFNEEILEHGLISDVKNLISFCGNQKHRLGRSRRC